jgi:lysophospholipase L1-like esterase
MAMQMRIMPVGDSITRGTYIGQYQEGPYKGQAMGLASPAGGGWRKPLQDKLRAAGAPFEFVGTLDYMAYGKDGVCDKDFDPHHHGLAGFSNRAIRLGGVVPTPQDVLDSRGVKAISAPDVVTALKQCKPDIVLLMSGANGFDAKERDLLIQTILDNFSGHLIVATITPQCAPRAGCERVVDYNASLPAVVAKLKAAGKKTSMVDMSAVLTEKDLTADGVHPNAAGMAKMSDVWFQGLKNAGVI